MATKKAKHSPEFKVEALKLAEKVGVAAGYGVTTAVATSNTVNISAINTLAGPVIDVVDVTNGDGTGQLYVNSPSVTYLDSIGGYDSSDVFAKTTPVGDFYLYTWEQANILCDTYNEQGLAGRTNWRLPESIFNMSLVCTLWEYDTFFELLIVLNHVRLFFTIGARSYP